MILPAQQIRARCLQERLIEPFSERAKANGMSYGLSAAGYDVRIAQRRVLRKGDFCIASTVEKFNMPDDLLAQVADKSTWARQGLSAFNTIIEPGWSGFLTVELVNLGDETLVIPEGAPIAQILFFQLTAATEQPYTGGKYDNQPDRPVAAILEG
jgi:dCTP deaminase